MRVLFATKMLDGQNLQPAALYALSAALKQDGHETTIVDARTEAAVSRAVEATRPDVLGVSAISMHYPFFQRVAANIKKTHPGLFTVFGGVHVTLVPQCVSDPGIDATCVGEGDRVFPALLGRMERGEPYLDQEGFWFRENGTVYENGVAPLITDLDSLPTPDRTLTDSMPLSRDLPIGRFISSRGCPFGCMFCSNRGLRNLYDAGDKYYRTLAPERFIEEIREAQARYKYRMLMFVSDVFALSPAWLDRFVELYLEGPHLPFYCFVRPIALDEHRARKLEEAGCRVAFIGLEAGNEPYRNNVLRRRETNQQLVDAVRLLKKHGIHVYTGNVLGMPGSTIEMELETVGLNLAAGPHIPIGFIYQPFPGTPLGEQALRERANAATHAVSAAITPSGRRRPGIETSDDARLARLALLFPLAAKWRPAYRALPTLINLPLRPLYYAAYLATVLWFRLRYMYGREFLSNMRVVLRLIWEYAKPARFDRRQPVPSKTADSPR